MIDFIFHFVFSHKIEYGMLMEDKENLKKILKYDNNQESDEDENQSIDKNDWKKDEQYYFKKANFHYSISNDHNFVEGTYNLG